MLPLTLLVPAIHLQTLVIGGGPNPRNNQIAIESNVRYIGRLLPAGDSFRVLFADGSLTSKSVLFISEKPSEESNIGPFSVPGSRFTYREPNLPRLDGPAVVDSVRSELTELSKDRKTPAFLYFTGHGSLAPDLKVSQFDLWNGGRFAVPDLVEGLKNFDKDKPVTLLMVQCHSGDFANVLYKNGDRTQGLAENRVCGFFASISARVAAGCTPAVNEENYQDFSSYFLAALSGQDRVGKKVSGADFDGNGKIGMNEAFCWSLVNDEAIDTPICTSDELLRLTAQMTDDEVFRTPYAEALRWASPAQKAALEGLSDRLKLSGDGRLAEAYQKYAQLDPKDMKKEPILGFRFICLARSVVLGHAMAKQSDRALKQRYATLVKDESQNPLRS